LKSMTGYSSSEFQDEKSHLMISLKSYNNRYLDVIIYIPPHINQIEARIRTYLSDRIKRGRVEFSLKIEELQEEVIVHLDKSIMNSYINVFNEIIQNANLNERISLSNILRIEGILKTEKNFDIQKYWNIIEKQLEALFIQFEETRIIEGKRTEFFIMDMVKKIEHHVSLIEKYIPEIEIKIKDVVKKRFMEILGNVIEESRMLAEIAVLMIKYDMREEIERMKSHLKSFNTIIREDNAIGKKLDFLCQELNREINTIGSKSIFLDVNNSVITIKDHIETIREQLRNVE